MNFLGQGFQKLEHYREMRLKTLPRRIIIIIIIIFYFPAQHKANKDNNG